MLNATPGGVEETRDSSVDAEETNGDQHPGHRFPTGPRRRAALVKTVSKPRRPSASSLEVDGYAAFSFCGTYRYQLRRTWQEELSTVLIIGFNPSTANATTDDATVRRCLRFSQDWGFGSLVLANLFALRSRDPRILYSAVDPIGPDNDFWISDSHREADFTVAAWGTRGGLRDREAEVLALLGDVHCLGISKQGFPLHPLYLPASSLPVPYRRPPEDASDARDCG